MLTYADVCRATGLVDESKLGKLKEDFAKLKSNIQVFTNQFTCFTGTKSANTDANLIICRPRCRRCPLCCQVLRLLDVLVQKYKY